MKKYHVETVFYQIGKVLWIPILLIGIWFAYIGYSQIGEMFACQFYKVCNFPCPGCGGTRAVYYFFSGHFIKSFLYHPSVIYSVLAYIHFMVCYFVNKHIKRWKPIRQIAVEYYIYILIAVILLQWVIKIIFHF